ncbi:MAG: TIGR02450 family Trp-rich protein [Pseudomonadales bacterium]|mgnify:CR=1 FL=1|uniref:TIGR02450 family Trp-rich protein n=1 Tax=Halopseudomonas TaxID=2901189 RepID=UPI000C40BBCB|nr:TIGR02450 family Trp-rich protein [Halopseudomonas aestusnigri]MAD27669.1 TIGR02450 family Trp-rich protein [Pseudomonadales bacterium]MEE2799804.1 TIGR02450 family Trp-rich protein [Pseudomonadota bacterium]HBT56827.1 TIGR02450 family Trp-rich protein [Pseudomonas sp.]MAK73124.1 TIGR02450 family Trp-rich protein [Pseudomonadales bacterium]MAP75608.1 TIGR02450 family Trp-rich protein [Pseudomonadales bacterium]
MNRINPKKLLHSKWTAVAPVNREKHFMITDVEVDEEGQVIGCEIEAVLSRRQMQIDWSELKDDARWLQGWK